MINEITIEGIVTRERWSYDKDVFFRVACYRDIDLPAKPDTSSPGRDEPDYVNIRYPGGVGTMFSVQKGQRVRINGFLQSREFKEGLVELLEKARKNGGHAELKLPEDSGLKKVAIERTGLKVIVNIIETIYQTGRKVADDYKDTMRIGFDDYLSRWNYRAIPSVAPL